MAYTDQPLYRAQALEPVAGFADVVMLVDQTGPTGIRKYGTPFYGIRGMRPIRGLGAHGVSLIWAHAAAPAGYGVMPAGAPVAILGAGGSQSYVKPPFLQGAPLQLLQYRFALRGIGLTGPSIDDIDLQVNQPGAAPLFGTDAIGNGSANAADQFQMAGDAIAEPASGANIALPAAFPAANAQDQLNLSESFIWEDQGPTLRLVNNGIASTGGAIGLRIWGFLFDLVALTDDGSWRPAFLMGAWRQAPATRVVVVPTAPITGAGVAA